MNRISNLYAPYPGCFVHKQFVSTRVIDTLEYTGSQETQRQ